MSRDAIPVDSIGGRRRWSALIALSLGTLMIVLDGTIVYVALPSIRLDLELSGTALVWVVNAFALAFSGSLILAGRLGDLYGRRKLFLIGIAIFTVASLACGLAEAPGLLVAGRAAQGSSGAIVAAVSLSLIMELFPDEAERAKAMGIYSSICVGGGSTGFLLGGVITSILNWQWIFLVNLPVGVAVYTLCRSRVADTQVNNPNPRLDLWGAVTVTSSLVLAVYAILNGNEVGWDSAKTVGLMACAAGLLVIFVIIESRVATPLIPLRFFRSANLVMSSIVRILWGAGTSAAFFIAQYMQLVLRHGPMEIGLAFLPGNLLMAALSLGVSTKLVTQFGVRKSLSVGLTVGVVALVLLAHARVDGQIMLDVLPGMILLALSGSIAAIPLFFATMVGVTPREAGLASGVVSTVSIMSNALGLAVLASLAASRTEHLLGAGVSGEAALTGGYRVAFIMGAACTATAAVISAAFLPRKTESSAVEQAAAGGTPKAQ